MKRASVTGAVAAALLVQVAFAAPAHAMVGLRAATCCARRCHHARSLSDAMRCCGVRPGDELAVTRPVGRPPVPPLAAQALRPPDSIARGALSTGSIRKTPPRDRPPPIFLLVGSLRL
jgi:hypothetical protein